MAENKLDSIDKNFIVKTNIARETLTKRKNGDIITFKIG